MSQHDIFYVLRKYFCGNLPCFFTEDRLVYKKTINSLPGENTMNLHDIKPISHIKSHAAEVLGRIAESGQSLGITQHGELKAVLVGAESYRRMQESLAFLKFVALGDEDIRTGQTRPVDEFIADMRDKLGCRR
jgi:prevent-host-death family protein